MTGNQQFYVTCSALAKEYIIHSDGYGYTGVEGYVDNEIDLLDIINKHLEVVKNYYGQDEDHSPYIKVYHADGTLFMKNINVK